MKKLYLLIGVLVATLLSSAFVAASAFATVETSFAEWLWEGLSIPLAEELLVLVEGEITLRDTEGGPSREPLAVLCGVVFTGNVIVAGEGELAVLLSLSGTEISLTGLMGNSLSCTNVLNCPSPKIWLLGLPWDTLVELYLVEQAGLLFEFFGIKFSKEPLLGVPGWEIECTLFSDMCTAGELVGEVDNNEPAQDVEAGFSEALDLLLGGLLGNCSRGGNSTALMESDGTILIKTLEGALAVAE